VAPVTDDVAPSVRGVKQVKSISRGTLILRTLAQRPMRPSDLSRQLDAPWATIYRTVRGLTDEGLLQRDPDSGEYSVGPMLWTLATTYIRDHGVLGVATPHLEHALPRVQGLLKLTEHCESEAVTLFAEQNPQVAAVRRIRDQYRLPLHCASFGQVLLAHQHQAFIDGYLSRPLERVTPRTIVEPEAIRGLLVQIREQGYAVSRGELQSDNGSIAVPIFRKDGAVAAALAAVVPLPLLEEGDTSEEHLRLLQNTAVTVSESLGWRAYRGVGTP
jgi:DNA-binding IclR family transcriptional regulator